MFLRWNAAYYLRMHAPKTQKKTMQQKMFSTATTERNSFAVPYLILIVPKLLLLTSNCSQHTLAMDSM